MSGPAEPPGDQATTTLERRVRRLEDQVDALIEAMEVLARGLEDGPMAEPLDSRAEQAARRTHELLLLAKSPPDTPAGT
jgi:hypothetical protein